MTVIETTARPRVAPPGRDGHGRTGPGDGAPPGPMTPGRPTRHRWRAPTRSAVITAAIGLLAAVLYTWGLSRNGMANSYYAAAVRSGATRAGRPSSSVARPRVVHHRRQAAGRPVGDVPLGPRLRVQLVEHAPARGGRRRRLGPDPAPPGQALGRRAVGPPGRPRPRRHARRRVDVPLQQPRRLPHPGLPGRRLGAVVGPRDRPDQVAPRWPARSSGSASRPRCSRPSWSCRPWPSCTCGPGRPGWAGASPNWRPPASPWSSPPGGGSPSSPCGRPHRGPTSARPPTTRSSAWCSATTASPASSAPRRGPAAAGEVSGSAAAPGCCDCSATRSAARSPG